MCLNTITKITIRLELLDLVKSVFMSHLQLSKQKREDKIEKIKRPFESNENIQKSLKSIRMLFAKEFLKKEQKEGRKETKMIEISESVINVCI